MIIFFYFSQNLKYIYSAITLPWKKRFTLSRNSNPASILLISLATNFAKLWNSSEVLSLSASKNV